MATENYTIAKGGMAMQDKITAVTYVSSAVAVYGGLTLTEWAAVVGTVVAVASFFVNWVYRHRHYKLAEARVRSDGGEE